MRRILIMVLAVALGLAPAALAQQPQIVEARDNVFAPQEITVRVGDSISFNNTGKAPHTATADDGSWDTGNLSPGASKSVTFAKSGTFTYNCIYHKSLGMVGKVTVTSSGPASPSPKESPAALTTTPSSTPGKALAEGEEDINANVPIGMRAFPFVALGLLVLGGLAAFGGYVRNVLKSTEGS